jgi:aspartyl-tRNA(Asn)/glutamyl-tRNA(Gln) amidotransferase subunit C
MALTETDVKRIAHLARVTIRDDEVPGYLRQLTSILELVGQMQEVDTAAIEPMAHAQDIGLRLRPDEVTEADHHEAFQDIAPKVEAALYLVPKVIE